MFGAWYTSVAAGCDSGTSCSASPVQALTLPMGEYRWHMIDYGNGYGYGQWTGYQSFTLNMAPESVVLGAPVETLTNWDGSFHWTGITIASHYYLEVQTGTGQGVYSGWYSSTDGGCESGTACVVFPAGLQGLANGEYRWRVLDYGSGYGYGNWADFQYFTLNR